MKYKHNDELAALELKDSHFDGYEYKGYKIRTRLEIEGVRLYPSEIHVVEAVGKHPEAHMAEIARILGVTRGAIQQTAGRLVKKGLVEKFMDESDRKRVYLELTAKGNAAFDGHEEYHAELSSRMGKCFEGLRPGEVASLKNLLDEVESFMDVYQEQKLQQKSRSR